MKVNVILKEEVYDEVFALMHNIESLNKKYEIGGCFPVTIYVLDLYLLQLH